MQQRILFFVNVLEVLFFFGKSLLSVAIVDFFWTYFTKNQDIINMLNWMEVENHSCGAVFLLEWSRKKFENECETWLRE